MQAAHTDMNNALAAAHATMRITVKLDKFMSVALMQTAQPVPVVATHINAGALKTNMEQAAVIVSRARILAIYQEPLNPAAKQ